MYREYGEIKKDRIAVDSISIKVDEDMKIILPTEQRQYFEYPIPASGFSDSIFHSYSLVRRASPCQYKLYKKTHSLKIHQFTLILVKYCVLPDLQWVFGCIFGPAGRIGFKASINAADIVLSRKFYKEYVMFIIEKGVHFILPF